MENMELLVNDTAERSLMRLEILFGVCNHTSTSLHEGFNNLAYEILSLNEILVNQYHKSKLHRTEIQSMCDKGLKNLEFEMQNTTIILQSDLASVANTAVEILEIDRNISHDLSKTSSDIFDLTNEIYILNQTISSQHDRDNNLSQTMQNTLAGEFQNLQYDVQNSSNYLQSLAEAVAKNISQNIFIVRSNIVDLVNEIHSLNETTTNQYQTAETQRRAVQDACKIGLNALEVQVQNTAISLQSDLSSLRETAGEILEKDRNISSRIQDLYFQISHIVDLQEDSISKIKFYSDKSTLMLNSIEQDLAENQIILMTSSHSLNNSLLALVNQTREELQLDLVKNQQLLSIQVRNRFYYQSLMSNLPNEHITNSILTFLSLLNIHTIPACGYS